MGGPRLGGQSPADPGIGLGAHRIGRPVQQDGVGTDAREQIEHLHRAIAPAPGKPLQAPEGGIVAAAIGFAVAWIVKPSPQTTNGGGTDAGPAAGPAPSGPSTICGCRARRGSPT